MEFIIHNLTMVSPIELLLILLAKTIEVTSMTLRTIFITKGNRKIGTVFSFIEVMLWIFIASRVIMGLAEAPVKGIVYSIGYSIGVYLGSWIETYIGMGRVLIQAIVIAENSEQICGSLREKGCGVTTMKAQGRDSEKTVVMLFTNRKGKEKIISEIQGLDANAVIITNDITDLQGGTISARWVNKAASNLKNYRRTFT